MKEVILLLCVISIISAFDTFSLTLCKRSKACFKTSKSCNIDQCQYVVTWKPIKYKDKNYLEIELIGEVNSDGGYIAIGFSSDKTMGDDGVVACTSTPFKSEINVVAGYNDGKNNILYSVTEIDSDFIVQKGSDRYGGSFNANIKRISCRFLRLISPELQKSQLKDLSQGNSFYLIVARGEGVGPTGLKKHSAGTTVTSDTPIDFSSSGSFNTVIGSSGLNSPVAKAHGIIMLVVWILCCSISIILARYYKNTWVQNATSTEHRWFNVHRSLQGIGYILLIIALILIFVHVGGYSKLENSPMMIHPILGLITSILFLINPFIALCRCNPRHRNRPIFNWIHFIVGTVAYILSIPTIMIGLRLPAAGLVLSQLNSVQWIVFFFVIFQFIIEIILEIHSCMTYDKNKGKAHSYENELNENEKAFNKGHPKQTPPKYPRETGRRFKLAILGIYISVAIVVTVVLSIIIIVN